MILTRHRVIIPLIVSVIFTFQPLFASDGAMTVRVRDGRIEEYVNGSKRRSYGSGIVDAATDGTLVAAVDKNGKVLEYVNGGMRRSYGTGVVRVRVSAGTVFAELKNGKIAEYVNGGLRRTF